MNIQKKSPGALGNSNKLKPLYSNSAASQHARFLEYFSKCPRITTMRAHDELGILHPCGRIMELRKLGYKIDTVWVYEADKNGVIHRIGMYVFHGIDWAVLEKRAIDIQGASDLAIDGRYELLKAEIAKRHLTPEQCEAAIKSLCKFLDY